MKKKINVLIAVFVFSMFVLTACANDATDNGGSPTTKVNPTTTTTTTTPTNGTNGNLTVTPNP